jgi:hypothetical protein
MSYWKRALTGGILVLASLAPSIAAAESPQLEMRRERADDRDPNIYNKEPGSDIPAYRGGDMYEGADLDPPGSPEVQGGYKN